MCACAGSGESRGELYRPLGLRPWEEGSPFERQMTCVDRHADYVVAARRVELVDLVPRRDAARRGEAPRGGVANGHDRGHAGALHQPFEIDVRIEELAAVRLERLHGL